MYKYYAYLGHLQDSAAILTNLDCKDLKDLLKKNILIRYTIGVRSRIQRFKSAEWKESLVGSVPDVVAEIAPISLARDDTG